MGVAGEGVRSGDGGGEGELEYSGGITFLKTVESHLDVPITYDLYHMMM